MVQLRKGIDRSIMTWPCFALLQFILAAMVLAKDKENDPKRREEIMQEMIDSIKENLPSPAPRISPTRFRPPASNYSTPTPCGVYLAPSTIPGAGLGMFAGEDYKKGDHVTYGDIIIPILEIGWHNGHEEFFWLWDEYTWSSTVEENLATEVEEDGSLNAASPGIGAALNCILGQVNIEDTFATCDNAGLHRSTSPGAGAFTPYHDRGSVAVKNIEEGEELLIDYGNPYFQSRKLLYGYLPLEDDFPKADKILYQFHRLDKLVLKYYSSQVAEDLITLIKTNIYTTYPSNKDDIKEEMEEEGEKKDNNVSKHRVFNALPSSHQEWDSTLPHGTANRYRPRSKRSKAWLDENGQCMDHIKNGVSEIPHAGRGAFASRFLKKGSVVAPAPLIHITNSSRLDMYGTIYDENEGYVVRDLSKQPIHQQLLLNYCYGHEESSILLSPYGVLVNLINHSPTPNTRLQWSRSQRHKEWFDLQGDDLICEMEETKHSGLSMDFVALRDIEEGEEITVDYGPAWANAWEQHVNEFLPLPEDANYQAAYDLNNFLLDSILPTMKEGGYPAHLRQWVHGDYVERLLGINSDKYFHRAQILDRYTIDDRTYYTVETFLAESHDEESEDGDDKGFSEIEHEYILFQVPRDAFAFDDEPYSRDHQQIWAFRHAIGIPDDMFPEGWKNLK